MPFCPEAAAPATLDIEKRLVTLQSSNGPDYKPQRTKSQ